MKHILKGFTPSLTPRSRHWYDSSVCRCLHKLQIIKKTEGNHNKQRLGDQRIKGKKQSGASLDDLIQSLLLLQLADTRQSRILSPFVKITDCVAFGQCVSGCCTKRRTTADQRTISLA